MRFWVLRLRFSGVPCGQVPGLSWLLLFSWSFHEPFRCTSRDSFVLELVSRWRLFPPAAAGRGGSERGRYVLPRSPAGSRESWPCQRPSPFRPDVSGTRWLDVGPAERHGGENGERRVKIRVGIMTSLRWDVGILQAFKPTRSLVSSCVSKNGDVVFQWLLNSLPAPFLNKIKDSRRLSGAFAASGKGLSVLPRIVLIRSKSKWRPIRPSVLSRWCRGAGRGRGTEGGRERERGEREFSRM